MGFEKRKVAKALCETESLDIALDLLTKETIDSNKQKAEDVLEKIRMRSWKSKYMIRRNPSKIMMTLYILEPFDHSYAFTVMFDKS